MNYQDLESGYSIAKHNYLRIILNREKIWDAKKGRSPKWKVYRLLLSRLKGRTYRQISDAWGCSYVAARKRAITEMRLISNRTRSLNNKNLKFESFVGLKEVI